MENDAVFANIPKNTKHSKQEKTALVEISSTKRQRITNNNSNMSNKSAQRLIANQLTMRTRPPKRLLTPRRYLYAAGKFQKNLHNFVPNRDGEKILVFSGSYILSPRSRSMASILPVFHNISVNVSFQP
ncbi:hypothetical protein AVEN_7348-1 [Araneus ventricosus]|uniref:Uncharacterized protein n=1 Tax=Araneus ventricosus TaxID=182803 RepID=A0A4Y2BQ83_ARAVE|nr:hypothetical protein AVEN_7348-1 [Araneus ventricosus]